jgi:hypothetical protein
MGLHSLIRRLNNMSHPQSSLSAQAQSLTPGRYKHFKGGTYQVLGVGRLSEDREQEMVIYRSDETGFIWLRPLAMFLENVDRDGYSGPRFAKIEA